MANEFLVSTPEFNDSECLHVLLVEESEVQGKLIQKILTGKNDYNIQINLRWVHTLNEAIAALMDHEFDVVLLDLTSPDPANNEAVTIIKDHDPNATIIILTNNHGDDLEGPLEFLRQGAQDYLIKSHLFDEVPNNQEILFRSINYALERNYLLQQIQKEHQENLAILQAINDTVIVCDRHNICQTIQTQSKTYCNLTFTYLMQVISEPTLAHLIDQAINTGEKQTLPWDYVIGSKQHYFCLNINPLNDHQAILLNNDITELKQAELIIEQEKKRLEDTLEEQAWEQQLTKESLEKERNIVSNIFTTDATIFVLTDQAGRIVRINQGTTRITGYRFNDIFGKYFWDVFAQPQDIEQFKAIFNGITLNLQDWHGEHSWRVKDHPPKLIAWSNSVVVASGEISYFLCNGIDLSLHQIAEEELKASVAQKDELARIKSHFIKISSHEFRTPLTTILGSVEIIRSYRDVISLEEYDQYLTQISETTHHLTKILDEINILESTDTEELEQNIDQFDLVHFLQVMCKHYGHPDLTPRVIDFICDRDTLDVCMSPKLLKHILNNLLSNALKYSPQDSTVSVELISLEEEVMIKVTDQGIGIPEKDRQNLFQVFRRGSNTSAFEGTGLGLMIVKKAIDLHHGTIDFVTEEGVGSTFIVTLPTMLKSKFCNIKAV